MKKTVFIYCGEDGTSAKQLAASLRTGDTRVTLNAANSFTGIADPRCDQAIVTADVAAWMRDRIETAYGHLAKAEHPQQPQAAGETFQAESSLAFKDASLFPFTARHKGFGRWYVMRGEETISGPHTKDVAQGLAA